ncbi:calmodulin-like protein 3 [Primulina eburnea]|uniref:calmodulin-like protein 3 n=1 Tax=Primulina eburnea TaxID=1245227 RepID=UPI003C6C3549
MIVILLPSILFIFGLIYTFSTIPTTKKIANIIWFRYILGPHEKTDVSQIEKVEKTSQGMDQEKELVIKDGVVTKSELRSVFGTFDKNEDGYITKQELRESLKNIGISAEEKDVDDMVDNFDSNGDGLIEFDEFCELFESISGRKEGCLKDESLQEAFDVFDGNKDGLITVEELGLVLSSLGLSQGKNLEDCKEMIRKVDLDGDGMVDFDEFKRMMRNGMERLVSVS